MLVRIVELVGDNAEAKTGLPPNHPLIKFAKDPESLESALALDDTVVWGALQLLRDADDPILSQFSDRMLNRKLFKCYDIRAAITHKLDPHNLMDEQNVAKIEKCCASVVVKLQEWQKKQEQGVPRIITDEAERKPYKAGGGSNGYAEQINVRTDGGELIDIRQRSEIVKSLSIYRLTRAYYDGSDADALQIIKDIVEGEITDVRN